MNDILEKNIAEYQRYKNDIVHQFLHKPFIHNRILCEYFDILNKLLRQRIAVSNSTVVFSNYTMLMLGKVLRFSAPKVQSIPELRKSSSAAYNLHITLKRFPERDFQRNGVLSIEDGKIILTSGNTPREELAENDIREIDFTFNDPTTVVSPGKNVFAFETTHLYGIYVLLPNMPQFYIDCLPCYPHRESSALFAALKSKEHEKNSVAEIIVKEKLEFEFEDLIFSDLMYYLDKNRRGPPDLDALRVAVPTVNPMLTRNIDELFSTPRENFEASLRPKDIIQNTEARAFVYGMLRKFIPYVQFCLLNKDNNLVSVSTRRFDFSAQANYNTLMYFARCPYHGMYVIKKKIEEMGFFFVYEYKVRGTRDIILIDFRFMNEKLYVLHQFSFFVATAFADLSSEAREEITGIASAGLSVGADYVPFRDMYEPSAPMDSVINSNDEYNLINFLKLVDGIDGWITHDRAIDLSEVFCMNAWELLEPTNAIVFDQRENFDPSYPLLNNTPADVEKFNDRINIIRNAVGVNPMELKCGGFVTTRLRHPMYDTTGLMAHFEYDRFFNRKTSIYRVFNVKRWLDSLRDWIDWRLDHSTNSKVVYIPSTKVKIQVLNFFFYDDELEVSILFDLDENDVAAKSGLTSLANNSGVVTSEYDKYLNAFLHAFERMKTLSFSFYKLTKK